MTKKTEVTRRDILAGAAISAISAAAGVGLGRRQAERVGGPELDILTDSGAETCLAWDPDLFAHTREGHPENHLRVLMTLKEIATAQSRGEIGRVWQPGIRSADSEEVLEAHDSAYVAAIQSAERGASEAGYISREKWSAYTSPAVFESARRAAGACIDTALTVFEGRKKNGIALVRPPGHHAGKNRGAGYCVFNNVAIAAKALMKEGAKRIAIVDLDVHHGNGTQEIFYRSEEVLYLSVHQNSWPHTGKIDMVGDGPGKMKNINVPLPLGSGDLNAEIVFESIIVPALQRFAPQMILVSMGFDTHWRDYQGGFSMSSQGQAKIYGRVLELSQRINQGKAVYILEGGYQHEALSAGISNLLIRLQGGQTLIDFLGPSSREEPDISETVARVKKIHGLS